MNVKTDFKIDAIYNIYPNCESTETLVGGETTALDKNGNVVELDESKITTEIARLEAEFDAQDYARKRASEYPSIPDQLDEIYHNGIDSWKAVIKQTKDKYPKG